MSGITYLHKCACCHCRNETKHNISRVLAKHASIPQLAARQVLYDLYIDFQHFCPPALPFRKSHAHITIARCTSFLLDNGCPLWILEWPDLDKAPWPLRDRSCLGAEIDIVRFLRLRKLVRKMSIRTTGCARSGNYGSLLFLIVCLGQENFQKGLIGMYRGFWVEFFTGSSPDT